VLLGDETYPDIVSEAVALEAETLDAETTVRVEERVDI
jgi:hypothetical protein